MEGNNNAPFRVGQKVICVKQHPGGYPVKDEKYEVMGLYQYPCCKSWYVDYGEPMPYTYPGAAFVASCNKCKVKNPAFPTQNYVLPAEYFAPIEPMYKNISSELAQEAMKQRTETDVPVKEVVVN